MPRAAPIDPPALWIRRVEAFRKGIYDRACTSREEYRDAVSLSTGDEYGRGNSRTRILHAVNLSYRYVSWFQAQATGEDPIIRTPRDASGDEITGEMVDLLLLRVLKEGGAMSQMRQCVPDFGWLGCSSMWYSFHADIITKDDADAASESVLDIVARAEAGDIEPQDGQDHEQAQALLRQQAEVELDPEKQAMLFQAAQLHDQMAEEEREVYRPPTIKNHQINFRRGQVGVDTFWDSTVLDARDSEFMIERQLLRPEAARAHSALKPGLARMLKGTDMAAAKDGVSQDNLVDIEGLEQVEGENHRVELLICWDKRFNRRHIVSPEMPDKYLELDSDNPYVDEIGEPVIEKFFPCQVFAPQLPPIEDPIRALGTPLVRPGWQQQIELNQLRTLSIARAKKHSSRNYVIHPLFKTFEGTKAMKRHLRLGGDGGVFDAPPGSEDMDLRKLVVPIEFGHDNGELAAQEARVEANWIKAMGMPATELTSMATADTATQEQIGIAAGKNQAEDVIKQVEMGFAEMVEGVRGLIRAFYPKERIAALVGRRYTEPQQEGQPSILEQWNQSSLDGDKLSVKFGLRALRDDAVRIKQIDMAIQTIRQEVEPTSGLPRLETMQLVQELTRALDVGTPREVDPDLMQLRQTIMALMQRIEEQEEEVKALRKETDMANKAADTAQRKASAGSKSGESKRDKSKTPTKANQNSGARRGTSSTSA